jgi:hypothetical protein
MDAKQAAAIAAQAVRDQPNLSPIGKAQRAVEREAKDGRFTALVIMDGLTGGGVAEAAGKLASWLGYAEFFYNVTSDAIRGEIQAEISWKHMA